MAGFGRASRDRRDGKPVESGHRAVLTLTPTNDGRVQLRVEVSVGEQKRPTPIEVRLVRSSGEPVTSTGSVEWREDDDGCHTSPVRREI